MKLETLLGMKKEKGKNREFVNQSRNGNAACSFWSASPRGLPLDFC